MARLDPTGVSRILSYIKNWVTAALGGKANSSHSHTKSQITDLPTIPSKTSQLTNDSGYITSSGSCNYANSAGAVAWDNVSGKPSSYTPSSHNHDSVYLKLSGGTITGNISKNNAATSWVQGRNAAPFRTIAASSPGDSQYVPCWSAKSYQGSWDCGPYTSNVLHLSYITDANYNSGSNVQTADFTFATDGTFNAKVLKQNGTVVALSGHTHTKSQITDFPSLATVATSGSYNDLSNKPNRNLLQTNGATSLGWSGIGGVANGSTLQIKTTDNTAPSICFHRSGYSHVVLLEQSGQLLVQQQGGTAYRVNHDNNTTLNGYRIYVG